MNKILVSACLIGENCKYNGGNNKNQKLLDYLKDKEYVLVCPESMGGLAIPRLPSEIEKGMDGSDVIDQGAKVYSKDGKDVTAEYLNGAKMSLDIALENEVGLAILKESSPSCGSSLIHDGNFVGNKKPGQGVTVALLKKHGIKTISEKDLDNLENIG